MQQRFTMKSSERYCRRYKYQPEQRTVRILFINIQLRTERRNELQVFSERRKEFLQ